MTDQQRRWLAVSERTLRTGSYWMVAVAGIGSLLWTPKTIAAALGGPMVTVWSILLLLGGLLAAVSATLERWLAEIPALPIIITGLGIYLVALWSIALDGEWTRITQTVLITGYAFHLASRWAQLSALKRAVDA